MYQVATRKTAVFFLSLVLLQDQVGRADCTPVPHEPERGEYWGYRQNGEFVLSISSASGAVGDVVAVTVFLEVTTQLIDGSHMMLSLCHDSSTAELLGAPAYSEHFLDLIDGVGFSHFYVVGETASIPTVGDGFFLDINFDQRDVNDHLPSEEPVEMMTLYYRLVGEPGTRVDLRFCDGELERGNLPCVYNHLRTNTLSENPRGWEYLNSGVEASGTLTLVEGPATNPDRPPEPPRAKVYPELPSDEKINFQVRVEATHAMPSQTEVRVEVYISADVEYSGVVVPINFDERYLRLARAEEYFLTGLVIIDNKTGLPLPNVEQGNAVVFSGLGINSYRIAAEGEEVHAATLWFDVLPAAAEIASTTLSVEPLPRFIPWIGVHHGTGAVNAEETSVRSEIEPITITNGVMAIRADGPVFARGDCNGDGEVNITDGVCILNWLFQGEATPGCVAATNTNGDEAANLSDATYLLNHLFSGGPDPVQPFPDCGISELEADEELGCVTGCQ